MSSAEGYAKPVTKPSPKMIRQESKTNKGKPTHARVWRSALIIATLAMGSALSAQPCTPAAPPYTEDFNAVTTPAIPVCMSIETISGNPWTTTTAPTGLTGNSARVSYTTASSPIMNSWLYTKGLVLTAGTSYRLSYKYGNNSTSYVESMSVAYGTAASAVTMTNSLANFPTINDNTVHSTFVDFTPSSTGTYYIGFKCYSIADQYYLYLDDISVTISPTCIPPTAVTVSNISATSADLSWTDNTSGSYNYEVRSSGAAGSGSTGLAASGTETSGTPAINITPLNAATTYAVYVQGSCTGGTDLSAWTDAYSFTTECTVAIAPYTETFDGALSTPNCWTNTATGTTQWLFSASGGTGPNYGVANSVDHTSGTGYFAWFDGSYSTSIPTLTSPMIDISPLTQALVSVWVLSNNVDDAALNTLKVQAYNGTAWVDLITYAQNNPAWVNLTAGVPSTIPSPAQFRLTIVASTAGSAFYNDILVDDFEVIEAPSCLTPTNLAVSNVTLTTADLSWTASLSEPTNGYEWEVRTSGAGGSGTNGLIDSGTTGAGITTASTGLLAANNTYTLYVRTDCGNSAFSSWASSTSFGTGYCVPAGNNVSYYINDFSTTGGSTNISNTGTGYSATGYGDFTSQAVTQSVNASMSFNAVFGSGTNTFHFRIWVDWNNDFDFDDAGELMFDGTTYQTSYTGTITVPAGTAPGDYRMRIRNTYTGTPTPCGTSNGETEDYTFTVIAQDQCSGMPDPGATVGPDTICADVPFNVTIANPSIEGGISYQWQTSTDGSTWTDALGVDTTAVYSATQTVETSYRVLMICSTGDTAISTPLSVAIAPYNECYCTTINFITDVEPICNVTFADINNDSPSEIDGSPALEDFSAIVGHVVPGNTYTFSATGNTNGSFTTYITAFFDWDGNGTWETVVPIGSLTNDVCTTPATADVTVPVDAVVGTSRMRVVKNYNVSPTDPCATYNYGQAEDYTIEVATGTLDCEGVVNGPALPGTACVTTDSLAGVWSATCVCVADPIIDCEGVAGGPALPGTVCTGVNGFGGIWSQSCDCVENVGVDEIAGTTGFAIYPNPASTTLYISTSTDAPVHVKVYDMVGTVVMEKDMVHQLDITKLATGSYTLVATDAKGGNEQHARFMKQ